MRLLLLCLLAPLLVFSGEKKVYKGEAFSEKILEEALPSQDLNCRVFLVRHGETEWNVLGLSQGWVDIPLNDEGKKQAARLAELFSELPVAAIYSSVLSRAKTTSEIIAAHHTQAEIIYDPTLRFYDPLKKKAAKSLPKEERKRLMAEEISQGASSYLKEVAARFPGKNVIIITHGKVIKHLIYSLTGQPDKTWKISIDNTGVVRVLANSQDLVLEDQWFDQLRADPH
jgi:broad specificity phosphatase PhoE